MEELFQIARALCLSVLPIWGKPRFNSRGAPQISHSAASLYLSCGERYRRKYLEKDLLRNTVPLARGRAVDHLATEDLRRLVRFRVPEAVEYAAAVWDEIVENTEFQESRLVVASAKDPTVDAARCWAEKVSARTAPIEGLVQPRIVARLGSFDLKGIPDYVVKSVVGPAPLDLKVGRERTQSDCDRSRQLTGNGLLVRARTGHTPALVGYDTIFQARGGGWKHKRLWSQRTNDDYIHHIELLQGVQSGIQKGVFLPAAEGDWRCSAKWCQFHGDCKYAQ